MSGSTTSTATPTPTGIIASGPGVGIILAARILGRLGDLHRFTAWPGSGPSPGWSPPSTSPGLTDRHGGPTKAGDPACAKRCSWPPTTPARSTPPWPPATSGSSCQRQAPQLGAVHHRHRADHPDRRLLAQRHRYQLRDVDGTPDHPRPGPGHLRQRYKITAADRSRPATQRTAQSSAQDEPAQKGVASRSGNRPVHPQPYETTPAGLTSVRNSERLTHRHPALAALMSPIMNGCRLTVRRARSLGLSRGRGVHGPVVIIGRLGRGS